MVDKRTMHEPSIRMPLLVRYPGLTPASKPRRRREDGAARWTWRRAFWTCAERRRWRTSTANRGRSWSQGDATGWRKSWFYEYNYEKQFPYTPNVRGVRTDEWKYIHYPHGDGRPDRHKAELYNLKADPDETTT